MIATGPANVSVLAQPGTIAFLVLFAMGVVLFFVFRSMARHLRKVNERARAEQEERFERERAGRGGGEQDGSASGPGD